MTPFDREDIYNLASDLDDVMDYVEAAADLVVLTGLGTLPAEMSQQIELLQRAAQTTAEAMPRLRTMKDLSDYWIEVNRIENEADKLYRRLLSRPLQRGVRRAGDPQAQGGRRPARGGGRRVRARGQRRRDDQRQGVLTPVDASSSR